MVTDDFVVCLLRELIRSDSTRDERGVVDVLEGAARTSSLPCRRYVGGSGHINLLVGLTEADVDLSPPEARARRLLWNCHMDTAPVGAPETWTYPPFDAVIDEGRIWGRGASDAKSGLAAMLAAMCRLKLELGGDAKGITLSAVAQETAGNVGTRELLDAGLTAAAAIVGEHSFADAVAVAYRGVIWAKLSVFGRSAHTGRWKDGHDAIALLIDHFLPPLRSKSWELRHELLPDARVTVTQIEGGHSPAMLADRGIATLDVRTLPQQRVSEVFAELVEICKAASQRAGSHDFILEQVYSIDGFESPSNHPLLSYLEHAIERQWNRAPRRIGKVGMCDGNLLAAAGIPTYIFGPGNSSGMGPDENCEVEKLVGATRVLVDVGRAWIQTGQEGEIRWSNSG